MRISDWISEVCASDLSHGTYGCGDRFRKLLGAHPAEIAAHGRAGRLGKLPRIGDERRAAANLLGDPLGVANHLGLVLRLGREEDFADAIFLAALCLLEPFAHDFDIRVSAIDEGLEIVTWR